MDRDESIRLTDKYRGVHIRILLHEAFDEHQRRIAFFTYTEEQFILQMDEIRRQRRARRP